MSPLEQAVLDALHELASGRGTVSTTAAVLHERVERAAPSLAAKLSEVEEAVRYMNRDGSGLRILHAEGDDLEIRLLSSPHRSAVSIGSVNVTNGNVQVGNHNQMQFNANTFGAILVDLRARIEQAPLPPAEKKTFLAMLDKLLASPVLGTILSLVLGGSNG